MQFSHIKKDRKPLDPYHDKDAEKNVRRARRTHRQLTTCDCSGAQHTKSPTEQKTLSSAPEDCVNNLTSESKSRQLRVKQVTISNPYNQRLHAAKKTPEKKLLSYSCRVDRSRPPVGRKPSFFENQQIKQNQPMDPKLPNSGTKQSSLDLSAE